MDAQPEKYVVSINGEERTVDKEKFEANVDKIARQYPDATIRMYNRETQAGQLPVSNYRRAVEKGGYTPVISNTAISRQPQQVPQQTQRSNESAMPNWANSPDIQEPMRMLESMKRVDVGSAPASVTPPKEKPVTQGTGVLLPPENEPAAAAPTSAMPDIRIKYMPEIPATAPATSVELMPEKQLSEIYPKMTEQEAREFVATAEESGKQAKAAVQQKIREGATIREGIADMSSYVHDLANTAYGNYYQKEREFEKEHPILSALGNVKGARTGTMPDPRVLDSQVRNYSAAARLVDDAKKLMEQNDRNAAGSNFVKNAGYGLRNGIFDLSTWDMGLAEGFKNTGLLDVVNKFDAGKDLTQDEQTLLDAATLNLATEAYFGSNLGRGYKAGNVTAASIPFMLEFLVNPLSGAGKGLAKSLTKYGIQRFGKAALSSGAGKIARAGIRAAGDIASAGGMAATTGSLRVAGDAAGRMAGNLQYRYDPETENIEYAGRTRAESLGAALAKSYGAQTIEYFSEMMGNYFGPVGNIVGKSKAAKSLGKTQVGKILNDISTSDWAKAVRTFERQVQWNGTLGEYGEEVAGTVLNSLFIGDEKISDIADLDKQIDTFLGVSLMGGAFSSVRSAGYRTPAYSARRSLSRADQKAADIMGGEWNGIRERIDGAKSDAELIGTLADIYRSDELNDAQKKAVYDYAGRRQQYEGIRAADAKATDEGVKTPERQALEQSYITGQEAVEAKPAEKQGIRQAMLDARSAFGKERLAELDAVEDQQAYIAGHPEEAEALTAYFAAKAPYDGLIDGTRTAIEDTVDDAVSDITRNTHTSGNVYSAVMNDGTSASIISGDIVLGQDGQIDAKRSGSRIIIRREGAYPEMVNISEIAQIDGVENSEILKETVASTLYEQETAKAVQEIEGSQSPYEVEDVVNLNIDGNPISGIIVEPLTPDGTTLVQFDEPQDIAGVGKGQVLEFTPAQLRRLTGQPSAVTPEPEGVGAMEPVPQTNGIQEETPVGSEETPSDIPQEERATQIRQPEALDTGQIPRPAAEETIPTDKDGRPDYAAIESPQIYADALRQEFGGEATDVAAELLSEALGKLEKAQAKTNPIERRRAIRTAETEIQKYRSVAAIVSPQAAVPTIPASEPAVMPTKASESRQQKKSARKTLFQREVDALGEPVSIEDVILQDIARGKRFRWADDGVRRGLATELGFRDKEGERRARIGITSMEGDTVDNYAEALYFAYGRGNEAEYGNRTGQSWDLDDSDIRSIVLDILYNVTSSRQALEAAKALRRNAETETAEYAEGAAENQRLLEEEALRDEYTAYQNTPEEINEAIANNWRESLSLAENNYGREEQPATDERHGAVYGPSSQTEEQGVSRMVGFGERQEYAGFDGSGGNGIDAFERNRERTGAGTLGAGNLGEGLQSDGRSADRGGRGSDSQTRTISDELQRDANAIVNGQIAEAESDVHTEPTDAQKEAGNYRKGHVNVQGFDITIEQPKGSVRSGVDENDRPWSQVMNNTYGYFKRTKGKDGDHIDVFIGDKPNRRFVFVVDQIKPDGTFDEHKVMLGFDSIDEARNAYLSNYEEGWQGLGSISAVESEDFRKWLDSGTRKGKPFADYVGIEKDTQAGRDGLRYRDGVDSFDNLADEYARLIENRENNPDFESELNEWRRRKTNIVRNYLSDLQSKYGTNETIIVFDGSQDTQSISEIVRSIMPEISESDLAYVIDNWNAFADRMAGGYIEGTGTIIIDVSQTDRRNSIAFYHKTFVHETVHAIGESMCTTEQLEKIYEEAKNIPFFQDVFKDEHYAEIPNFKKGSEVLAFSIGSLTGEGKAWAFDRFMNGILTSDQSVEMLRSDIPYTKQIITDILNHLKNENEQKRTVASSRSEERDTDRGASRKNIQGEGDGLGRGRSGTGGEVRRYGDLGATATEAARRTAAGLNVPVRIVENIEDITSPDGALQERQRASRGWYDPGTGEIVVVAPNHLNPADAVATVLHEAVGHYGMRNLLGGQFDAFLDKVYAEAADDIKREIFHKSQQLPGRETGNIRLATEEYIAELAEQGIRNPFAGATVAWEKIKSTLKHLLQHMGIDMRISDNDLRYLLWKSYNRLQAGDSVMERARKIAADTDLRRGMRDAEPRYSEGTDAQRRRIIEEARRQGTYMQASNGKPTNLSPEQWATVRTQSFKEWFGDWENDPDNASKVVDENGEPMVVYHGTNVIFSEFKKTQEGFFGEGIYFTPDINSATEWGGRKTFFQGDIIVIPAFLNIRNPLDIKTNDDYQAFITKKVNEYDGIIGYHLNMSDISDYVALSPTQIKSASDNTGAFNPNNPDIRFRGPANQPAVLSRAQQSYEQSTARKAFRFTEAYQDSMLGLKRLQESIVEESGKLLNDYENAYAAENQMSSKSTYETEFYRDNFFNPMIESVSALMKKGYSYEEVIQYVIAKSGLERNEVFAMRDAQRTMNERVKMMDAEVKHNLIDEQEYKERLKEYEYQRELDYKENRQRDYSGLTQLVQNITGEEEVDVARAEAYAEEMVETMEANERETDALWTAVNNATKETLRKSYESGLMTKANYTAVRDMFQYYVPMRGWQEDTAADVWDYVMTERSPFNAPVNSARGRQSVADDPLATIGNMGESAILQGNRNLMKQRFLNMAMNHRTKLLTVKGLWYENHGTSSKPDFQVSLPNIPENATPDEIADAIDRHETLMRELEKEGRAQQGRAGLTLEYKALTPEKNEHIVTVKRGGKEYVIYVNGNPRAAQAVNGLTNERAGNHKGLESIQRFNRQLAANFTTRNPAFVLSNMARDMIFGGAAVFIKEDARYNVRFLKNLASTTKNIWPMMYRYYNGKLDPANNQADRYFLEFLQNGGETGYTALHNVGEYKKLIDRKIVSAQGKVDVGRIFGFAPGKATSRTAMPIVKGLQAMAGGIGFMNRCAEDVSRFSTYMTSRQMGRSIQRSVADAKEITVNFNKKGGGGYGATTFKSLYLFFNAAVQSLANFQRLAKKSPLKFSAAVGGYIAMGVLNPVLNEFIISMFGDDDDKDAYNNLPDWARRNNFCFYLGDGNFITIPIAIELRAFYGMGEMFYQSATGNMRHRNVPMEIAGQISDLLPLNIMGNNGEVFSGELKDIVTVVMPDAGKPIWQVVVNKDFFGKPVFKDTDYNKRMPGYTKAYRGTSQMLVGSAEFLNEISGGDQYTRGVVDVNPAVVEHIFENYFGGTGKTINQLGKTISMIWNEDQRVMRNIPVASRFISATDDRNAFSRVNEEYYNYFEEYRNTQQRVRGYENEVNTGDILKYAEKQAFLNSSPGYQRYLIFGDYEKEINDLSKMIREAETKDERAMWEMQLNLTKTELVERLRAIEE